MSETTIATTWETKKLLHLLKNHKQIKENKRFTEDEVIYDALVTLAEQENVQLPETLIRKPSEPQEEST